MCVTEASVTRTRAADHSGCANKVVLAIADRAVAEAANISGVHFNGVAPPGPPFNMLVSGVRSLAAEGINRL